MKNENRFCFCELIPLLFQTKNLLGGFFLFLFFSSMENSASSFWNVVDKKPQIDEMAVNLFNSESDSSSINDLSFDLIIQKGMDYLAIHQNADGSFGSDSDLFGDDPGVAALCGMAFLASGSSPGRGKYGGNIDKIIDYLLSLSTLKSSNHSTLNDENYEQIISSEMKFGNSTPENLLALEEIQDDFRELLIQKSNESKSTLLTAKIDSHFPNYYGLIAKSNRLNTKPMYGHGYATLFLSECFGMSKRSDLKTKLEAAVNLIIRTQNSEGGWRYEPVQVEIADISVTTCQISALRAAKNAGFFVPDAVIDRALEYVKKCQNSDGGFRYMLVEGSSGYSRTAAALHALQSGGEHDDASIKKGFEYLNAQIQKLDDQQNVLFSKISAFDEMPEPSLPDLSKIEYYYYGIFYAALAFWMESAQQEGQDLWLIWEKTIIPSLLQEQNPDGSWDSVISKEVSTAMILCALLVSQEKLSFFVR